MRRIFVDTSAWDALADSVDPNHEVALLFRDEIAGGCSLSVSSRQWATLSDFEFRNCRGGPMDGEELEGWTLDLGPFLKRDVEWHRRQGKENALRLP